MVISMDDDKIQPEDVIVAICEEAGNSLSH